MEERNWKQERKLTRTNLSSPPPVSLAVHVVFLHWGILIKALWRKKFTTHCYQNLSLRHVRVCLNNTHCFIYGISFIFIGGRSYSWQQVLFVLRMREDPVNKSKYLLSLCWRESQNQRLLCSTDGGYTVRTVKTANSMICTSAVLVKCPRACERHIRSDAM